MDILNHFSVQIQVTNSYTVYFGIFFKIVLIASSEYITWQQRISLGKNTCINVNICTSTHTSFNFKNMKNYVPSWLNASHDQAMWNRIVMIIAAKQQINQHSPWSWFLFVMKDNVQTVFIWEYNYFLWKIVSKGISYIKWFVIDQQSFSLHFYIL